MNNVIVWLVFISKHFRQFYWARRKNLTLTEKVTAFISKHFVVISIVLGFIPYSILRAIGFWGLVGKVIYALFG